MSLTQALAALIVDTLPSADAREKARAGFCLLYTSDAADE